ncbi:hypothetical protein T265_11736 [Opisthorchis viverrini]|uniref:Uncharacterized protein n=1 Tax=Opisthorchis viverrini TaxID=6198 RepID=A0A074YXX4_OPIVI|nr:hypothetical protein T265_11736 [Opisthorchis viverrini]KER19518.1 hypothetical protein T265_11736 [Opisthorchis viverrini]
MHTHSQGKAKSLSDVGDGSYREGFMIREIPPFEEDHRSVVEEKTAETNRLQTPIETLLNTSSAHETYETSDKKGSQPQQPHLTTINCQNQPTDVTAQKRIVPKKTPEPQYHHK